MNEKQKAMDKLYEYKICSPINSTEHSEARYALEI